LSEQSAPERGRRKSLVGTVVSTKMDKTAVVAVERRERHPLYRKIVRLTKRYKAHDPNNGANLGDVVRIEETRPISKEKRWRIAETLVQGNVADVAPRDIGVPEEALLQKQAPEEAATELAADIAEPAAVTSTPVVPAEGEASPTELVADVAEEAAPAASAETEKDEEKGT
jgi:small subunit ribosomal protein S17